MAAAVLLAACGGGPTLSGSPAPKGTSTVAKVTVSASPATIAVDGSTAATITATALNSSNAGVSGQTVSFGSSSGGVIGAVSGTTNASGVATATLTNSSAAAGSNLTVTATIGGVSGTATVGVVAIQQSLSLQTSLASIPSDSSKPAAISAVLRDANNNALAGTTVAFTASSGVLAVTQAVTDANGIAKATLTAGTDPTNRPITVNATAGSTKAPPLTVSVSGTTLSIAGPANLVLGSPGTYTIALVNSGGTPITGETITLKSALGNTLTPSTLTTTADGSAQTFTLTATKGGAETITASGLGQVVPYGVTISTQNFAFTSPANLSRVNLGATGTLKINWSSNGVPVANTPVNFQATRGTLSAASATTDGSGNATVTITSDTAGPSVISAGGTGPGGTVVTAQLTLDFIATQPATLGLQASPSTIATQASSTITATVRDANDNLVEGQLVDFSIAKDSTGGSLSVASATTDPQGQATTTYTASTTTSATDGIEITGTADGTAVTGNTSLTVGGQTVFLSLGTGNTISAFSATQYSQPWSVQAVDAAGNGVNGVSIAFSVTSLGYGKGSREWNGTFWQTHYATSASDPDAYILNGNDGCKTEDLVGNGVLEPGEDYNKNGKLDPGLVASTDVPSAVTANGGSASFNLVYPKDHAFWVAVQLTATATVSGTQSSSSNIFWLEGLAADFDSQTIDPPGYNSPYGVALPPPSTCANPN